MKKNFTTIFLSAVLIVINSTTIAQSININGPAGSGRFGQTVTVLPNGNYVVTDPTFDDGAIENVGAVYLYNGSNHTLISTLKGSTANDQVGYFPITTLSNGDYLVSSPYWNNGEIKMVGAVTLCNGNTGISGVVSSSNSLVGSRANDQVGNFGVIALSNGNYIVVSSYWDNGAIENAGAVTWGNGSAGTSGVISSSNSLVGSTKDDQIGIDLFGITVLSNGNYLVCSPYWDNGEIIDAGAVTWGNGSTGTTGAISSSNSLVGSTKNDNVGIENRIYGVGIQSAITVLSNGNYVVSSPSWDNGTIENAGAATWGNGNTGITGEISSTNSLVGSKTNDQVGLSSGITALTNGNYVVNSSRWDNGSIVDAGAVTWGNGSTGISGEVSSVNSLVGTKASDQIGNSGVIALSNGNYVVSSVNWDNGTITDAGAATWGNGNTGIAGEISSTNSLVGSKANDKVSIDGIAALTNGNYVVRSVAWKNGTMPFAGAVTWGNGDTGISGEISSSNSLVGSIKNDQVGSGSITALSNGNYVVSSPSWANNSIAKVGAVTWGNGSTGISGVVSSSNSLVGSTANDGIGLTGNITALSNGNYVVISPLWDNNTIVDAGAVTWGNGNTGISGVVSSSNSLVGSTESDGISDGGITALSNGNYVVSSSNWDNGSIVNAGAATWGNGNTGITGELSSSNSLVGSTINDNVSNGGIITLSNGNYVITSSFWANGSIEYAGAITWGNASAAVVGIITNCNSVLGTSGNGRSLRPIYNSNYDYLIVSRPFENIITIYNPTSISLANSLDAININISGSSPVPLIASGGCRIIATLAPNGSSAVSGNVDAKVWVESSVPTYSGEPFVARHYEITPVSNASNATGKVTLYFTQQEFDDFNAHPESILDLPVNATDEMGKANLKIGKYPGISSDGSGLPGTYSADAIVIDPDDENIVWNATQNRWEVSFDVTGFSGFIVQTSSAGLPLTLLEFNGKLQNQNAVLNWRTENEQNNSLFQIERSINGKDFSSIGNVSAANTTGVHQYGFTDYNISTLGVPVVYYRLKQLDLDGRFVYSKIIALSVENKNIVLIYPNPATNELNLSVTAVKGEQAQLRIIDNKGRVIKQKQVNLLSGNTSLSIDINSLSKGMYYLELKGEGMNERKSFVKQ